MRHVERAEQALREGDRLLRGAVTDIVDRMVAAVKAEAARIDQEASTLVRFQLKDLPLRLVPYLEDPFAQAVAFNLHCERTHQSHTQAAKDFQGGAAAVSARNLVFLPPIYHDLWEEGHLEKTRLVAIANRNLTAKAYLELADMVRTRRKEDVDERLLRLPPGSLQIGRRGPGEAMEAARTNGWLERLATVEIPGELVVEAGQGVGDGAEGAEGADASANRRPAQDGDDPDRPSGARPSDVPEPPRPRAGDSPAEAAQRTLRAGLAGARLAPEVVEALGQSPDPGVLVERFLTAHKRSGNPDPGEVTKTIFFAHAGPMQKLVADDKLLLRHFRPVKTQKRGQLFYRLLEVIEETLNERANTPNPSLGEAEAMVAVRRVIVELNKDPNRFLMVPDDWLGEVTRRHLYFGSRTRKEGAAYKWFRKLGSQFYLGAHKTEEEVLERAARRAGKRAGEAPASDPEDQGDGDDGEDDEDDDA